MASLGDWNEYYGLTRCERQRLWLVVVNHKFVHIADFKLVGIGRCSPNDYCPFIGAARYVCFQSAGGGGRDDTVSSGAGLAAVGYPETTTIIIRAARDISKRVAV